MNRKKQDATLESRAARGKKPAEIQAEGNQSFVISTGRKQLFHIGELVGEGGEHGAPV